MVVIAGASGAAREIWPSAPDVLYNNLLAAGDVLSQCYPLHPELSRNTPTEVKLSRTTQKQRLAPFGLMSDVPVPTHAP